MNALRSKDFDRYYAIDFFTDYENTITINVVYDPKHVDRSEMNSAIDYTRASIELYATKHRWDSWIIIREKIRTVFPSPK